MYIRVTTRCNMRCEHCGFSCTARGKDMSREVFIEACKIAAEREDGICIGGGEPTLHPLLFDYIGIALSYCESEIGVLVITNGKITDAALRLNRLDKQGKIAARLSLDVYHERVDERVVQAFKRENNAGYNTVTRIRKAGRAKKNQEWDYEDCLCDDLIIEPSGKIWACAHRNVSFGTVFDYDIPEWYTYDLQDEKCSNTTEFKRFMRQEKKKLLRTK